MRVIKRPADLQLHGLERRIGQLSTRGAFPAGLVVEASDIERFEEMDGQEAVRVVVVSDAKVWTASVPLDVQRVAEDLIEDEAADAGVGDSVYVTVWSRGQLDEASRTAEDSSSDDGDA